ncbi:MAG: cadherin-like beta sandwich domain-containing protein, partial [Chloroflexi bacterium]|nr:cadherin-like beta sandwich domain-containing protein [Chloroflexota bacterium]
MAALGMALTGLWQAAAPARMAQAAQPAAAPAQDARPAAAVVTRAKVKSLSKASYYANNQCAVLMDGQVLCWGSNGFNELSSVSGVVSVPLTMTGVSDAVDVTGGDGNWCVLHANQTMSCVGYNDNGRLGNGTATDTTSLSPVVEYLGGPPMGGIKQMSTGPTHRCAVMNDGAVRCWGEGKKGKLGYGAIGDSSVPVTVTGIVSAVNASMTDEASCAVLANGNVQCWGKKAQLGVGATVDMSVPVTVLASAGGVALTDVVELFGSYGHVCARTSSGQQYCWGMAGNNNWSGNGKIDASYPVRVQRIEDQVALTTVQDFAVVDYGACAALEDGTVRCWGSNYDGEVGVGDIVAYSRAVTVTLDTGGVLTDVVDLGNAGSSVCALTSAGNVYCWGDGDNGTLGNGTLTDSTSATLVIVPPSASTNASLSGLAINPGPPLDQNFVSDRYHYYPVVPNAIASMLVTPTLSDANAAYTITGSPGACTPATSPANCALSVGANTITVTVTAEDGTTTQNYVLHVERLGLPIVTVAKVKSLSRSVYSGNNQCAILMDGQVLCWGRENYTVDEYWNNSLTVPVTVTGVTDAVDVSHSSSSICIVHADETAGCMGYNQGSFGNGTKNNASTVLTPVIEYLGGPPMRGIRQMVNADSHGCAVMTNGTVRCWGRNIDGELGNGTTTASFVPVTVTGITNAVQVALTYEGGSCALLSSRNVQCWGNAGTPIVGASSSPSIPVTVLTSAGGAALGGIVELRGSERYVCGLTAAGEQYCWGASNQNYYLAGNGTDTDPAFYYPVRAQRIEDQSDLSGVVQVAPAERANCAVMADGTVRCWGSNRFGQVGVGDTTNYSRAVTVTLDTGGVLTGVVDMGYTGETMCALTSVGRVYCWGQGSYWQIGNGVMTNSLRATLVIVPPAALSNDASLGGLVIHPGTLAPAFAGATYAYTATVPNSVASTVVTPTLSDPKATYTITGSPGACAPATSPANCALSVDVNLITVTVTAADGVTTQAYTI